MKRLLTCFVLLAIIISLCSPAPARAVKLDQSIADLYRSAVINAQFEMWDEAINGFTLCAGYQDSGLWLLYCQGRLLVAQGQFEDAEAVFRLIPDFDDGIGGGTGEEWAIYSYARQQQVEKNTYTARESYEKVIHIADSRMRWKEMNDRIQGKNNMPWETPAPKLGGLQYEIPATAVYRSVVYSGPGKSYTVLPAEVSSGQNVGILSAVRIIGDDCDWYLISYESEGTKYRGYCSDAVIGLDDDSALRFNREANGKNRTIKSDITTYYGPDASYAGCFELKAKSTFSFVQYSGEDVQENGYYLIEYDRSGKKERSYIRIADLK